MHCKSKPCMPWMLVARLIRHCNMQMILLGVALGLGQWLEKKKIDWLGEAGVALLLGIAMGILSRVFTFSKTYVAWMGFQVNWTPASLQLARHKRGACVGAGIGGQPGAGAAAHDTICTADITRVCSACSN